MTQVLFFESPGSCRLFEVPESASKLVSLVNAGKRPGYLAELAGDLFASQHAGVVILNRALAPITPPRALTPRQLEMLTLLSGGLSQTQIAARLGISLRTVRHHMAGLRERLGLETTQQVLAAATVQGWLPPP